MGILGTILGFLTAVAGLALEWLRRPKKTLTPTEASLERRQKYLEAKEKFARSVGKGDSHEIKKQLDTVIDELNNMRSMRKARETSNPN